MNVNTTLSEAQITDLARPFVLIMETFYKDPEHEKGFQQWLQQRQEEQNREEKTV